MINSEGIREKGQNIINGTKNIANKSVDFVKYNRGVLLTGVLLVSASLSATARADMTIEERMDLLKNDETLSTAFKQFSADNQKAIATVFLTEEEAQKYEELAPTLDDGNPDDDTETAEVNEEEITEGRSDLVFFEKLPENKEQLAELLKDLDGKDYLVEEMKANDGKDINFKIEDYPYMAVVVVGNKRFKIYYQTEEEALKEIEEKKKEQENTKPEANEDNKKTIKADPKFEVVGGGGVLFTISGNKLTFNSTSHPDIAKAVTSFNKLNDKIKTPALKYIQDIINDKSLSEDEKNTFISAMIQIALGKSSVLRISANTSYKDAFVTISDLAGTKAHIDKDGNVDYIKSIIEQTIDLANKKPLDNLLKNPTFAENWKDAKNLQEKKVELGGKKTLTPDEMTMLDMAEYASFKEFPNTYKVDFMRAYLSKKLDMSYLATAKDGTYLLIKKFVSRQYFDAMKEVEKEMETKKDLNPGNRKYNDVAVEDL